MTEPNSPILDFYPADFQLDLNGKKQDWEAIVLIPFIDQNRLIEAIRSIFPPPDKVNFSQRASVDSGRKGAQFFRWCPSVHVWWIHRRTLQVFPATILSRFNPLSMSHDPVRVTCNQRPIISSGITRGHEGWYPRHGWISFIAHIALSRSFGACVRYRIPASQ